MSSRRRVLALFVAGTCSYAISTLLARTDLHLVARAVIVFAITKTAGDILEALARGFSGLIFYEDFLRELSVFVFLGLVTAGAIAAGKLWTGTEVGLALPAIGAYAFLAYVPRKRRGARE
ncbi:MAG: hypothetical protein ACYC6V_08340 [Bacillota bacterium]